MIRTLFFLLFFILFFFGGLIILIPLVFLRLFRLRTADYRYTNVFSRFYARAILKAAGAKLEIRGTENFPSGVRNFCVVSNHQSYADIPIVLAAIPVLVRFIAKKELFGVPVIGFWLLAMESIPIDRGRGRSAIQAIERGVESIKKGKPVVVFPEGTRSKRDGINSFKRGSLKLALRSDAVVIPMTIDGSYRLWEERHKITATRVICTIHKSVYVSNLSDEERQNLSDTLEATIRSALS